MSEFVIWWKDSDAMKWIVESYARVQDAFSRVAELKSLELEVLPVKRVLKGV